MKKPKFCKVCKEPFYPHNSLTPICSYKCYEVWTSEKEVKKRVKEMKANLQTLSDLESIAKIAFQAWIRKRDEEVIQAIYDRVKLCREYLNSL